jgi:hypothetical protein
LRNLGVVLIIAAMAAGCASTPNTFSNAAPDTDFSQYSTFGFFRPLATDEQGYESMESNFLKVAMSQELDRRGLTYSESPDLEINFYIHTKEKIRSRSVPTTSVYYDYRDPFYYDPWIGYPAYETRIDQYTEGTLNIDVVDANTKKLVWEGSVSGRITDKAIRNMEQTIDEAVKATMTDFPIPGDG